MKKIALQLVLFTLLFVPQQATLVDRPIDSADFGAHHNDWADLFRLTHQLLFYQADLNKLIKESTDDALGKYLITVDSLQASAQSVMKSSNWLEKGFLGSFKNEVDPMLGTDLTRLEEHDFFHVLAEEVFPNIKRDQKNFLRQLDNGKLRFVNYLPQALQDQYQKDIERLRSSDSAKAIGGIYNRYIYLLKKLAPTYRHLLNETSLSVQDITEAYVNVCAEEYQLDLVYYFLKKHREKQLYFVEAAGLDEFFTGLTRYQQLKKLTVRLANADELNEEDLKKYTQRVDEAFLDFREELVAQLEAFALSVFKESVGGAFKTVTDYVKENKTVQAFEEKLSQYVLDDSDIKNDYVDIKQGQNPRFWTRVRLASGTYENLAKSTKGLKGLAGEVLIVYKPEVSDNDFQFHGDQLFKKEGQDLAKVQKAIGNLHVEVPLGLTIQDITLSTLTDIDAVSKAKLYGSSRDSLAVSIGYASKGIWTNFKYDFDKKSHFAAELQLPSALGLNLIKVEMDEVNWQPRLIFSWQSGGFIAKALEGQNAQLIIDMATFDQSTDNLKKALNGVVKDKIKTMVFQALNDRKDLIKDLLVADEVVVSPLDFTNEALSGNLRVKPKGIQDLMGEELADEQLFLTLNYRCYSVNGLPAFQVSKPTIPFGAELEQKVKSMVESMLSSAMDFAANEIRQVAAVNVYEGLEFTNLRFDLDQRSACGEVIFHSLNGLRAPLCYDFGRGEYNLFGLETVLKTKLRDYISANLNQFINDQFNDIGLPDLVHPCNNIPAQFDLFGLTFQRGSVNGCEVTATIAGRVSQITVEFTPQGMKLKALDPTSKLKAMLVKKVKALLDGQRGLVKLTYPRFENGLFKLDLISDLSDAKQFSYLDIDPIRMGTVSIDIEGNLVFNGANLGDTFNDVIKDQILNQLDIQINETMLEAIPRKIDFDGIATIRVTGVASTLARDLIKINGEVDFESMPGLTLGGVSLHIRPSDLSVSLKVDTNAEELLIGGLVKNFMNSFLGSSCADEIGICNPQFDASTMTLTGIVKINIAGVLSLPGMEFSLSPKKFDFTLAPQITLPGVYPVAPLIVAIDPTLRFDFEEEKIYGYTTLTLGGTEEARATAKVGKIDVALKVDLANLLRMDIEGDLIALNMLPLYYGKGYLDLNTASFGLSQGTSAFLSPIIHYEQKMDFYGKHPGKPQTSMFGSADIAFLGMSAALRLQGQLLKDRFNFQGSGAVNIPLVALEGEVSTSFIPYIPMSHLLYGEASLRGELAVGDFDLSSFEARLNIHQVSAGFEVLGAQLGLNVPVADALTEDKILDLILSMFDFSLEDLAEMLKTLKDFGKGGLKLDFGDTDDVKGTGRNNKSVSTGTDRKVKSSTLDEVFRDINGAPGEAAKGTLANLNLLVDRVNTTKSRTVSVRIGTRCSGTKILGRCIGTRKPVYRDKTITEELFNYTQWTNHWTCLPNQFKNYYALYDPDANSAHSKKKVYDLIHPGVGNRFGKKLKTFPVRTALEADRTLRAINGDQYLCLSKEDNALNDKAAHCISIDDIPNSVADQVLFSGNLAYDNDKVYVFTSARLPQAGNHYCASATSLITYSASQIIDMSSELNQLVKPQCNDCEEVINDRKVLSEKIRFENLKGYRLTGRVPKNDPTRFFEPLTGIEEDIQLDFMQFYLDRTDATDSLKIEVIGEGEDEETEKELDWPKKEFRSLVKSLPVGSLVLFDGNRMILADAEKAEFQAESTTVDNVDILNAFYELTGKIWIEIDGNDFKPLFRGYLPDGLSIPEIFTRLAADNNALYDRLSPLLDEYIQNWIYYGSDPRTIEVTTSNPGYTFNIWDYRDLEDNQRNLTYTFSGLSKPNSPNNAMSISQPYHKIWVSDLTKGIEINDNTSLTEQRAMIENGCDNSVYRNLLFFHARDTLNQRLLLSAKGQRVVYGIPQDSTDVLQSLSLVMIKAGCSGKFEQRNNPQIHNLNYDIQSTDVTLDTDLEEHVSFFGQLMEDLVKDENAEAYIEQFPFDSIQYRGIIFKGTAIELIWEDDQREVRRGVINEHFAERWKEWNIGGTREFNGQKLLIPTTGSNAEKAALILKWFDGFNQWHDRKSTVSPAALLRSTTEQN